jgi:hypothetical protein
MEKSFHMNDPQRRLLQHTRCDILLYHMAIQALLKRVRKTIDIRTTCHKKLGGDANGWKHVRSLHDPKYHITYQYHSEPFGSNMGTQAATRPNERATHNYWTIRERNICLAHGIHASGTTGLGGSYCKMESLGDRRKTMPHAAANQDLAVSRNEYP